MTDANEIHGHVVITWPRPSEGLYATPGAPLVCDGIRIHDAETGEEIADGTRLAINLGATGWTPSEPIVAEITRVIADDGPLGRSHCWPYDRDAGVSVDGVPCAECGITWAEYEAWRKGGGIALQVFRYEVSEMRVEEA